MFGKKEEAKLIPMSGYPKNVLDIIKKNLVNNTPIYEVNWDDVKSVSVDLITIRPSYPRPLPLEMNLVSGTTTEYLSAWKKGLGKFVMKDFAQRFKENGDTSNLSKYKFSPFISQNLEGEIIHNVALIRFIEEDDYKNEKEFAEMKEYHAISFSYTPKDGTNEKNVAVIKIFQKYNDISNESRLSESKVVSKGDDYYSVSDNFEEMLVYGGGNNNVLDDDEVEEPIIVELNAEKQKEFINEESLF